MSDMKLRFIDGYEFTATSKRDACEKIWRSMRFKIYKTLEEWMAGNAKAMGNALAVSLTTKSIDEHFDDMVRTGVLIRI
jgi:hypothetical protein